ncbi:hypothetical protein NHX12_022405 [Muraenolepis orangiensis]|uniref:Placenta-specific protein 9 n=1 Tax=Muraenolepis orangiensis TaxID=630683 RepID=A0A9Q0EMI4_9TELE|nr:hypothetical protein NHX12_022405 [Muraenolepis orangiensis]
MTRPVGPAVRLLLLLPLLLLLIGGCVMATAGHAGIKPRAVRSSACQDHSRLHNRLDVVEKKVEDTVEKLEDELAILLDAIEAPEWGPLLDITGKPSVDILDGQGEMPVFN